MSRYVRSRSLLNRINEGRRPSLGRRRLSEKQESGFGVIVPMGFEAGITQAYGNNEAELYLNKEEFRAAISAWLADYAEESEYESDLEASTKPLDAMVRYIYENDLDEYIGIINKF
jgi:hypothetical protein